MDQMKAQAERWGAELYAEEDVTLQASVLFVIRSGARLELTTRMVPTGATAKAVRSTR